MMLLLVSGATATVDRYHVGHFIVPSAGNAPGSLNLKAGRWAMDNGAFSGFDADRFERMLDRYQRYHAYQPCLFVAAPDVVGNAQATLELWPLWSARIRRYGYPVAFVLQDGIVPGRVPWPEADAVFIGGSTQWKLSRAAASCAGYARALGRHVHAGRVNSERRARAMGQMGAQSFDGGQFSMFPDRWIPVAAQWAQRRKEQPYLGF